MLNEPPETSGANYRCNSMMELQYVLLPVNCRTWPMKRNLPNVQKGLLHTITITSPRWLQVIDNSIKDVRSRLSKCSAELNRLKINGRFTKRTKRNREEIRKECGEITHHTLICYMEKLKKRIKYLSKKRSRKLRSEKARKLNNKEYSINFGTV